MAFGKKDLPEDVDRVAAIVVDAVYRVCKEMGPGLLEGIYESCLAKELERRSVPFERQKPVPVFYRGEALGENLRLDLLVDGKVIVEVKSVESLLPVHEAQVLTYLRLTDCELGLLVNFNVRFIKEGIQRIVLSKK